jgi:flagellar biosynthesis protein FlhF
MEIKTFRAKTMPQALDLVRRELGPEATVLHTRERNGSLLARVFLGRHYEIAATVQNSPSSKGREQPRTVASGDRAQGGSRHALRGGICKLDVELDDFPPRDLHVFPPTLREATGRGDLRSDTGVDLLEAPAWQRASSPQPPVSSLPELQSLVAQLRARSESTSDRDLPSSLFDAFTDLIEADVDQEPARDLIDRLRNEPRLDLADPLAARARLAHLLQSEFHVAGPIDIESGAARVVALVGPTGVGKTTTIAKLAANFRLRENRRVGLITVDTYRIAAVEQLRTYADIIDLPMKVVSTPREMREAVAEMRSLDLILMDTAGRSPRDEVKIRELRTMLAEAACAEVHLVLSAASSARSLVAAAEKFAPVGVTSLLVTKLDEATALGNLVSLARASRLPFSYLTDGQNVPDDIAVADPRRLSQLILNIQSVT